ncbi:MAG: MFS transporter [Cyanobacteria bacterium J083]|nr:MAG: MFS transporter [Cyanobacteria bacterium J083]
MVQVSKAVAKIIAPVLGGVLVNVIGLKGVLSIDFATFLVAVASLLIVRLPSISRTEKPKYTSKKVFLWQEMVSGWRYIRNRPGLVKLLSFIAISYFTMGVLEVVFWPFILNFGSSEELGRVLSIGGCGMLVGSVMISVWGGPSRKIDAIVGCIMLQGLFVMLGGLRNSVIWAAVAIFGYLFAQPIIVSCNQAIWQSKVPQALQGRVFALQQMLERSLAIIAYLTSGPLVDQVLTPLMAEDNFISRLAQKLIRGEEPPQAIALILILVGTINLGAAMIAYGQPSLRRVEEEVPDAAENKLGLAQDFI